jgi:hypothetical protein
MSSVSNEQSATRERVMNNRESGLLGIVRDAIAQLDFREQVPVKVKHGLLYERIIVVLVVSARHAVVLLMMRLN